MYVIETIRDNPLKVLFDGDRRRRSFLAAELGIAPARLGALIRSPLNLNALEAFALCRLYGVSPYRLINCYEAGLHPLQGGSGFDFDRFYPHRYSEKNFWRAIELVSNTLKLSEDKIAQQCELTLAQYQHYSGRWRSFPFVAGMKLARWLGEDLMALHSDDLDLEALRKRLLMAGEVMAYLPARYENGAGSKMRLFDNALEYLRLNFGEEFVRIILASMGFPQEALRFKDKNISILAFKDLHQKAISLSGDKLIPFELGRHNRMNQANKTLFGQLMNVKNHRQFYERVGNDIASKVDLNFFYEAIKLTQRGALIEARMRPARVTQLSENYLDRNVALYIYGHFLVGPGYFGLKECPPDLSSLEVEPEQGVFRFLCRY